MASRKALKIKAFDLTPNEKIENLGEVKSLLLRAGLRIQRAKTFGARREDWLETYDLVKEALTMAADAHACDQALTPLATCYFYKGHVLLGLGETERAYTAYQKAALSKPHSLTDYPSVQQADDLSKELRDKLGKGMAPWNEPQGPSSDHRYNDGEQNDSFTVPHVDELPLLVTKASKRLVTQSLVVRQGAERQRSDETPGLN